MNLHPSLRPVGFDVRRFLMSHDFWSALDFTSVPEPYRAPLRDYFRRGVLPPAPLRTLLEGDVAAVRGFRDDLPGLLALTEWMSELPGCCWGSADQVQHWAASVARGGAA